MEPLFSLSGIVTPSSQRGRRLGFPTANLDADAGEYEDGIYLAYAYVGALHFPALLFIGSALTFGDTERKIEAYLLAPSGPEYGERMKVEALKKLRENRRFESPEALVAQIQRDEQAAKAFFGGAGEDSSGTI